MHDPPHVLLRCWRPSDEGVFPQLSRTGQHDRTPVTTKHEKRFYAKPLFAVSYGSFQGRPLHSKPLADIEHSQATESPGRSTGPTVFHTGRLPKTGLRLTRDSRDRESEAHAPAPPCAITSKPVLLRLMNTGAFTKDEERQIGSEWGWDMTQVNPFRGRSYSSVPVPPV
jgi:hypothetical protein